MDQYRKEKLIYRASLILTTVIFIILTFSLVCFLRYNIIAGDDVWQIFITRESLWDEFLSPDHGRYLAWFQMKLFGSIIPFALGIHPQNFINTFPSFIISLDFVFLCLIVSSFAYIKRKIDLCFPLIFTFSAVYYFKWMMFHNQAQLCNLSPHFGYSFSLLLYLLFWLLFIRFMLNECKPDKYILVSSIGFLASLNDAFFIQMLFSLSLIVILDVVKNKKFDKYLLMIFLSVLSGCIISLFGMFKDSHVIAFINPNITGGFNIGFLISLLPEFVSQYFKYIFLNNLLPWFFFVFFALILYFSNRQNKTVNKVILYSVCMITGFLFYFLTLIIGGTDTFYEKGVFWIAHHDHQLIFRMVLLSNTIMFLGFLVELLKTKKSKFILILLLILTVQIPEKYNDNYVRPNAFYQSAKNWYTDSRNARRLMYQAEKMLLFYGYKNKEALLPVSVMENQIIYSAFWVGKPRVDTNEEISQLDNCVSNCKKKDYLDKIEKITYRDSSYVPCYIFSLYKNFNPENYVLYNSDKEVYFVDYRFVEDKRAFDAFHKYGGVFTEKEIERSDFQKLYDKNFVLNN